MRRSIIGLATLAAMALVAAACGGGGGDTAGGGGKGNLPQKIGKGEGALKLVAWDGYTEPGWVKPFESQTGCKVSVTVGTTSDDMVRLMRQGGGSVYDGVSASGDATLRLIAGGDVAPVNTKLIPAFKEMIPALQSPPHNTVDGVHYGVPYMWGPNFLMYRTDIVKPAPTSWDVVFEPDSPYAGKITDYDSPIYIADAAMYLKTHQPDLKITDPYELTQDQFNAAVDLLQKQHPNIAKYWSLVGDETGPFKSGDLVVGTAWPVNEQTLLADKVPVEAVVPKEGVTGWADTWMMSANAKHPNCMYMWMQYTSTAKVQAQVAESYGATPSNAQSCSILQKDLGADITNNVYHCGDASYLKSIALWKTPLADCGDNRGSTCVDYNTWTQKWLDITGA
jgi:putative spermidine/putrescine transport system substrate-binding protein